MSKFIIEGPTPLRGSIKVAGNKNHVLPMMAACLLVEGETRLHNVPEISDVEVMAAMFRQLGATVERTGSTLRIDATNLRVNEDYLQDAKKMRASLLVLGGAIGRLGEIAIAQPGGDIIGVRSIGVHEKVFSTLGFEIESNKKGVKVSGRINEQAVVNVERSVTPTENAILAAVLGKGARRIRLAAQEPHVVALCEFLNSLGAKITGVGGFVLDIEGVDALQPGEGWIIPDQLEAGTFAIAAAATQGEVTIEDFIVDDHDMLLLKFDEMGVRHEVLDARTIRVLPSQNLKATNIQTQPYPGFPSDLQAPFAVLMTQAKGKSEVFEIMYEGRLNYLFELQRMGADVGIRDPHVGFIEGPSRLHGTELISFDVRAGATVLLAAMVAHGTTVIDRIEHIDRGYEHIDTRFNQLGAKIKRVN